MNKWINCWDAMPDTYTDVLALLYNGMCIQAHTEYPEYEDNPRRGETTLQWYTDINTRPWTALRVTHWMPLPEPPEETP